MATEYYKFIKVSKHGQEYYYNCPDFFNSSSDCFNYMRADLNRVLLNSIPSQYSTIDCNSVTTTSTTSSTTVSTTIGTTTIGTTSSTTSSTTKIPCDIGFESVNFVNNETFPYDYNLQQGYIQIKLKSSTYSRQYQFRVMSGTNVIKDWTNPVTQNIVAFKLNCANYTINVRDYNDVGCVSEILNINIPCLTTTSTSTTSTTTVSTTTTSTSTTTSTTTQFTYAPCAFYYNNNDKIYYKDIINNVEKFLTNSSFTSPDISLFNGNLYLHKPYTFTLEKISLSNLSKSSVNLIGDFDTTGINSATHDSNGNYYLANGSIFKFIPSGSNYTLDSMIVDLSAYYPSQGDIVYISNMNAFAMTSSNGINSVVILVKADGSNLILREVILGDNTVESYAMFIYNNILYCTIYGQEKNYVLKIDFENGVAIKDTNIKLLDNAFGGTQNANCMTLTYNDQFYISNIVYNCIDNGVFNLVFDINNGGGNYEYSIDGLGYSQINGTKFNFNLNISTVFIYIRDINKNKTYKFRRNRDIFCDGFIPTTTTTTIGCVATTNLVINGITNVVANSTVTYSVGSYSGSPIISYIWQVEGGTIVDGNDDGVSVDIVWNGGVTAGKVTLIVTNCNGSKSYFRRINIA